jgi:hypothetical protein
MKKYYGFTALSLLVAFTASPFIASAVVQTPVDGGSSILLIAGISYASKKLAAARKKNIAAEK